VNVTQPIDERWITQVLGASTTEEGRMREKELRKKTREEQQDRMQTLPAEHLEQRKNR
jgi:hypothetical protein